MYSINLIDCALGPLPDGGVWRYEDCGTRTSVRPAGSPLLTAPSNKNGPLQIDCQTGSHTFSYVVGEGTACVACSSVTIDLIQKPEMANIPDTYVCRKYDGAVIRSHMEGPGSIVGGTHVEMEIDPYVVNECGGAPYGDLANLEVFINGVSQGNERTISINLENVLETCTPANPPTQGRNITVAIPTTDGPDCDSNSEQWLVHMSPVYGTYQLDGDYDGCIVDCSAIDFRDYISYPAGFQCLFAANAPIQTRITLEVYADNGGNPANDPFATRVTEPGAAWNTTANICAQGGPCYNVHFRFLFDWIVGGNTFRCLTGPMLNIQLCEDYEGSLGVQGKTICNDQF